MEFRYQAGPSKNTVAIIQARMGASRLPNKMLLHLHGYPVVEWVYRRVSSARLIDRVIFALPVGDKDDVLAYYLRSIGAEVFRGSEDDLVDRFYQAALSVGAEEIVRICADNPLICPEEIDRLIDFFHENSCDYAYNHIPRHNRYPDGLGAEICKIGILEEIHVKAVSPSHREHLFNYLVDNSEKYIISTFDPPEIIAHPELKLDIDTMEDYKRLMTGNYHIKMNAEKIVAVAMNS
jgi:spore coat polysaccharide biosynthesis protein SpsF